MAIATIERDPARDSGASELRFRLLQEVCRTPEVSFWRALDRRSGKSCVVRVIDADREESSRRLGDLHRERTLAERIGHPGVLRCDVPLIEVNRIFQLVDPEPARTIEVESEGGRLAVLNLLVAVAAVLAGAHGRGVFHGAFSRASCLCAGDGRLIVQGFMGDAPSPAAVRDGVTLDHRAFLGFAHEMLRHTGGPPPRLRRYFTEHLAANSSKLSATPLADLCADLRESLEDTFPWPLAGSATEAAQAADPTAATTGVTREALKTEQGDLRGRTHAAAKVAKPPRSKGSAKAPAEPKAMAAVPVVRRVVDGVAPAAAKPSPIATAAAPPPQAVVPPTAPPAVSTPPRVRPQTDVQVLHQTAAPHTALADTVNLDSDDEAPRTRSLRPWIAALVVLIALGATVYWGSKSRVPSAPALVPDQAPMPAAEAASPVGPVGPAADAFRDPGPTTPPASRPVPVNAAPGPSPAPATSEARRRPPVVVNRAVPARPPTVAQTAATSPSIATAPAAAALQAVRSRVVNLVSGGNRALNALEPGAATEAFAAALALSPDDPTALEGSQRARRLQGVAALMRDAREASARGDYARAVQGYSQALSNDPRNRGLADALAAARRNVGRDATSAMLAEGHAALGAGRLEEARAAFEKALATDPLAPGARRAAEQAATAILLRDEAESRRTTSTPVAGQG